GCACRGGTGNCDRGRRSLHTPFVFQVFDELSDLNDRQIGEVIDDLLARDVSHDKTPSEPAHVPFHGRARLSTNPAGGNPFSKTVAFRLEMRLRDALSSQALSSLALSR